MWLLLIILLDEMNNRCKFVGGYNWDSCRADEEAKKEHLIAYIWKKTTVHTQNDSFLRCSEGF